MKKVSVSAVVALVAVLAGATAWAQEEDVSSFYEVTTSGTTQKVKAGEKGKLVLAINTKKGAHISDEAPLKVELSGQSVKPEKARLSRADSVSTKPAGKQFVDPRFEVPFAAQAKGKGAVDAKLTFFVCTEKLCSKQTKTLSVPVEID